MNNSQNNNHQIHIWIAVISMIIMFFTLCVAVAHLALDMGLL